MVGDTRRMFEHACAFVDCARYCQIEPNNIKFRMKSHSVAGIVNSAFACEVFIKTLLVFRGIPLNEIKSNNKKYGHNLETLWTAFREKDHTLALLVEHRLKELFNSDDENMFDNLIANISNSFDYWRYIYEQETACLNLNFLVYFRDILREVCCNQLFGQSWGEYTENSQTR